MDHLDVLHSALSEAGLGGDVTKNAGGSQESGNGNQNNNAAATGNNGSAEGTDKGDGSNSNGGNTGQNSNQAPQDFETLFESRLKESFGSDSQGLKQVLDQAKKSSELLAASPYKTGIAKALDELVAKNVDPQTALKYITTDLEKMSDREIYALKMRLDNPELKDDEIESAIDRKFKIGSRKENDEGEKDGLVDLKIAVRDIRTNAQEVKNKMLEQGESRDQVAAKHLNAERISKWNGEKANILNEFKTLKIPLKVDAQGKVLEHFNFEVGNLEAASKQLEGLIDRFSKLQPDENGKAFVRQVIQDHLIINNLGAIMRGVTSYARGQNDQWWANYLDNQNISRNNNGGQGGGAGNNGSTDQQIADAFAKFHGGTKRGG